jgi:hypothetical protein
MAFVIALAFLMTINASQLAPTAPTVKQSIKGDDGAKKSGHSDQTQTISKTDAIGGSDAIESKPKVQAEKQNSYDPKTDTLYRWYLRATILGVIGGIIALGILIWQSILMRKSADGAKRAADVAEQSLHILQRAEVLISEVGFVSTLPMDNMNSILRITFKNFGNTRADRVTIKIDVKVPGAEIIAGSEPPPFPLGPHDTQTLSFSALRIMFKPEIVDGILKGKIPMRFEGKFSYDDVFGEHHAVPCAGKYHQSGWIME